MGRQPGIVRLAVLLGLLASAAPGIAQSDAGAFPPLESPAASSGKNDDLPRPRPSRELLEGRPDDLIYVQDAEGQWIAVPLGALPGVEHGTPQTPSPTPVFVSQVSLDGEVRADHAHLRATIRIEITEADRWFQVPLGLPQAHVQSSRYVGPGEAAPTPAKDPSEGLLWSLRGKGAHELTLELQVPVSTIPAGRQLQLTLPPLPAGWVAHAALRVPGPRVVGRALSPTTSVEQKVLEDGTTQLDCDIAGSRWELSWRERAEEAPLVSQVITALRLRREAGTLRLTARQQCNVDQGAVTALLVRMPAGFSLSSVERVDELERHPLMAFPLAEREGWMRLQLDAPAQEVLELDWTLNRPFPEQDAVLRIEGLEVEGARVQRGTIEVESIEGHRIEWRDAQSTAVEQASVADDRPESMSVQQAFQYQRQPFRLSLALAEVEPRTTVEPRYFVQLGTNRIDLYVEARVEILAGSLSTLEFDWPARDAEGWQLGYGSTQVAVEGMPAERIAGTLDIDPRDASLLRLHLARPAAGKLQTLLHFTRPIDGSTSALTLTLPDLRGTFRKPGLLSTSAPINREVTVTAPDAELAAGRPDVPLPLGISPEFQGGTRAVVDLGLQPPPLTLRWIERARAVAADTTLTLRGISGEAVRIVQEIAYRVGFGEISTLVVNVPERLQREMAPPVSPASDEDEIGVRFHLGDGTPLEGVAADDGLLLHLPRPLTGRFRLIVDSVQALPRPRRGAAVPALQAPIVQSLDAEFGSTLVQVENLDSWRVDPAEPGWQPWLTRAGQVAWLNSGRPSSVGLTFDDSTRNMAETFTVETAFLSSSLESAGETTVVAQYLIQKAPRRLSIELPEDALSAGFTWNTVPLPFGQSVRASENADHQYTVELPASTGGASGRLLVRYRLPAEWERGIVSREQIRFPKLAKNVWIGETFWEMQLPEGQLVFESPLGMTSQYSWQRQIAVWMRRPTSAYRERRNQLIADGFSVETPPSGNLYAFRTAGGISQGRIGAMSLPFVVVIGAGVMLALGFVFGRIPATRNLLSVLVLAFVFAVCSVWQWELMLLLVQPALLGLLLAIVATVFDAAGGRRSIALQHESTLEVVLPAASERRSSVHSSLPSAPQRTAVYRPEGLSGSGGHS